MRVELSTHKNIYILYGSKKEDREEGRQEGKEGKEARVIATQKIPSITEGFFFLVF